MEIIVVGLEFNSLQSLSELNSLAERYPVVFARDSERSGRAWVAGLQRAQGQYIQLMHQDVLLAPEKIDSVEAPVSLSFKPESAPASIPPGFS